jgi:hypothetical protein
MLKEEKMCEVLGYTRALDLDTHRSKNEDERFIRIWKLKMLYTLIPNAYTLAGNLAIWQEGHLGTFISSIFI